MKYAIALTCVVYTGLVLANFDLRLVSRELKKDAPWSLDGSAQNLRSDVKHLLQRVMNQFILLFPEATWKKTQIPSVQNIQQSIQQLAQYIEREKRADKVQQVKTSLDYILGFATQVEQKLAQGGKQVASAGIKSLLGQKKELLGPFKEALQEGRASLG